MAIAQPTSMKYLILIVLSWLAIGLIKLLPSDWWILGGVLYGLGVSTGLEYLERGDRHRSKP